MKKYVAAIVVAAGIIASPYITNAAKVIIDPGHGGSDPGAIGVNGLYEKTVNTDVSNRLHNILRDRGYEVIMTRSTDRSMTLQERVELARSSDADLFISVHANAHPSKNIRGTMVLYHDANYPNPHYPASAEMTQLTPESRKLAQDVLKGILDQVPNVDRGIVPSSAYVVRNGNIPSVLVELAFLSNTEDAAMLATPNVLAKYAKGIANGIAKFLPPAFSDIGAHWARESIVRLNSLGITNGQDGKFHPERPLTRAELVAFVDRSFGFSRKNTVIIAEADAADADPTVTDDTYRGESSNPPVQPLPVFADLTKEHWAYETLAAAVESGVVRGYPDGTLRPDAPVSRAEVAVVFDRLIGSTLPNTDVQLTYADVDLSNWAYGSIARLTLSGIVGGVADRQFAPDRYVTRAEMATMVDRQLAKSPRIVSEESTNTAL